MQLVALLSMHKLPAHSQTEDSTISQQQPRCTKARLAFVTEYLKSRHMSITINGKHIQCHMQAKQHNIDQHSTARHSTARHGTARHGTVRHGTARHSTAQHSTAQHSMAHHSSPTS